MTYHDASDRARIAKLKAKNDELGLALAIAQDAINQNVSRADRAEAELQLAYENADFDEPLTFEEYRADLWQQVCTRAKYKGKWATS